MKFKNIIKHLTGVSCPIFGISWTPPESDRIKAHKVIRFLEDRRVLYNPYELECRDHCFHSIIDIRHFLTSELQDINEDSEFYTYLKAMRIACRKFLDKFSDKKTGIHRPHGGYYPSLVFDSALGELRGVFGIMIAQIAVAYGIDIESDLASILPEESTPE